jgi:hypothetical protein
VLKTRLVDCSGLMAANSGLNLNARFPPSTSFRSGHTIVTWTCQWLTQGRLYLIRFELDIDLVLDTLGIEPLDVYRNEDPFWSLVEIVPPYSAYFIATKMHPAHLGSGSSSDMVYLLTSNSKHAR